MLVQIFFNCVNCNPVYYSYLHSVFLFINYYIFPMCNAKQSVLLLISIHYIYVLFSNKYSLFSSKIFYFLFLFISFSFNYYYPLPDYLCLFEYRVSVSAFAVLRNKTAQQYQYQFRKQKQRDYYIYINIAFICKTTNIYR